MTQFSKIIGADLAKSVFQLTLADAHHHVIQSKRLNRAQFREFFVHHPPAQKITQVRE